MSFEKGLTTPRRLGSFLFLLFFALSPAWVPDVNLVAGRGNEMLDMNQKVMIYVLKLLGQLAAPRIVGAH